MTQRLINWALALAIVLIYAGVCTLDGPSDHAAEQAQLLSLQDAIKTEAASARLERSAALICGENAGVLVLDSTTVQCTTKRGAKTRRASL